MFARLGVGAGALNITKWQTKTDVMIWIVGSGCLRSREIIFEVRN